MGSALESHAPQIFKKYKATIGFLAAVIVSGVLASGCAGLVSSSNKTDSPPPDVSVSGAALSNVTATSVTVSWQTNIAATSQVAYGATVSYGSLTTLNGTLSTSHQQAITGLKASTAYHLQVMSTANGNQATSSDMTFTTSAGGTPPTVSISAPAGGATVSGTVTVSATAASTVGMASVQFQVDGVNSGAADTTAPYSLSWNTSTLANGNHTLTAVAKDTAGNSTTSAAVTVNVNNVVAKPVVSITSPVSGATVSGTITVSATATSSIGIASVQFQVDGANVGAADTTAPYNFSWNSTTVANGSHVLTAVAKDTAGSTTTSTGVTVTVNSAASKPTVSITAPAAGATVSATVTVSATASSTVGIASVQFQVDGANVGAAVTVAPYNFSWNTTTVANGNHTLTAVAKDTAGNTTTSAGVTVNVNNVVAKPTVSITAPTAGATVSATVTVSATATSSIGIASVQFQVDGVNSGAADTTSPYSLSWNTAAVANGNHVLTAVAKDTAGSTTTSAGVTVNVNNTAVTPTVAITSPTTGAAVSGTIAITATASDSLGIASVQLRVDGANLGAADTTAPYNFSLDTTTLTNGSHTLTAVATDTGSNVGTSPVVTISVSNSVVTLPSNDTIMVYDTSGTAQTNRPVSVARPFKQGEIANFVSATVGSTAVVTQTDVKNRWPDGSLKFAVVSFVVPSIPANGAVAVTLSNQSTGNNTGFLAKADMLGTAYNFDAQIKGSGGAPTTSARAILTAASACADPGTDPSGPQSGLCRYWLKGPVVTAVIIEDRSTARAYDFDAGDGSKALHPIFECWFYAAGNRVHCGYTVENAWISSSAAHDMRDETWGFSLTGGNTAPTTLFTQASFKQIGGSRLHKQYCVSGPSSGPGNQCGASIRVDHNFDYLLTTKAIPNYDTTTPPTASVISSIYSAWTGADQSIPGTSNSGGNGTVGNYLKALGSAGQADWIGPDQTWSVLYLYSMDDRMLTVMLGNDDLVGWFPWHVREADASAGSGKFFDAPTTGSVATNGRIASINARQVADFGDPTFATTNCGGQYAADAWAAGTTSWDGINGENIDPSHTPASGYTAYLLTGQFHYLEEVQLHASYEMGSGEGCDPSPGSGSSRQGSWGITQGSDNIGGPRGPGWWMRTVGEAAFISPDGSPEAAYFNSKLQNAIASDEGAHNLALTNSSETTYYNFGKNTRLKNGNGNGGCGSNLTASPLGLWWCGNAGQVDGSLTARAETGTKFWMENFYVIALGMLRDFGYPTDHILQFTAIRTNGLMLSTATPNMQFLARSYVVPGMDSNTNNWIQSWAAFDSSTYFSPVYASWDTANESGSWDNAYQAIARAAAAYEYPYTDANGLSGATAWTGYLNNLPVTNGGSNLFSTVSPKFSIIPRTTGGSTGGSTPPAVSVSSPTNGATVSGMMNVTATATPAGGATITSVQVLLDGANAGAPITTPPYTMSWNTATASNGSHILSANATDSKGNVGASAGVGVTVNNAVAPPTISGVSANPSSNGAIVTWTTSTAASSEVFYGTTTAYGQNSGLNTTLVTSHSMTITGLTASTVYDYEVQSKDGSGNTVTSGNFTFTTTATSTGGGIPTALGWYTIPNSTLLSVCPNDAAVDAVVGCAAVIEAWSSAVADTKRNRLVIWGGGHNDYWGNEVYALDLTTQQMLRLNNPSPVSNVASCPESYTDGTPSSRHTYDGLTYIPGSDVMLAFGGSKSECGYFASGTWTLNLATLQWTLKNPGGTNPQPGPGAVSDYDPNTGLVFLHDYVSGLYSYNITTNTWNEVLADDSGIDYHMTGAIDPKRKLFIVVGGCSGCQGSGVQVYNIAGPTYTKTTPNVASSCSAFMTQSSPGISYDPVLDKMVIWPNFGNTAYIMDDTNWTCTTTTFSGGPPDSHQDGTPSTTRGTFGRFRYFPSLGVYAVVNDADINAHTLRLTPAP